LEIENGFNDRSISGIQHDASTWHFCSVDFRQGQQPQEFRKIGWCILIGD